MVIADEIDGLDLDSRAAVHVIIHADGIADDGIFLDTRLHPDVEEALVLVVSLDDVDGRLRHVVGILASPFEVQTILKIFLFTALHSGKRPSGDSRTLFHDQFQEDGIFRCRKRIGIDGHILEIALHPQTVHDGRDVLTGNRNLHSLSETCLLQYLVIVEALVSLDGNAAHNIFAGIIVIYLYRTAFLLPECHGLHKEEHSQAEYPIKNLHSFLRKCFI